MKQTLKLSLLTLAISGFLTACNNDGANGINGTNGIDGVNGTNGIDGKDASGSTISLSFLGRHASGQFGVSAAEIVSYDAATKQVFVVNAQSGKIDVLDISSPSTPHKTATLALADDIVNALSSITDANQLGAANSVSVYNGVVAIAIEANPKTNHGYVAFYQASDKSFLSAVEVGSLPDMLTFTAP